MQEMQDKGGTVSSLRKDILQFEQKIREINYQIERKRGQIDGRF